MATMISEAAQAWLDKAMQQSNQHDLDLLTKACVFAESIIDTNKIPYAKSSLQQGLLMADELLTLNCDSQTLAAALIYPGVNYNQVSKDSISKQLNPALYKMISGAQRLDTIHNLSANIGHTEQQQQTDNLRKMLLSMADDIRIVLIKLAEHLAILKYLKHCPVIAQQQVAKKTLDIYAPLANRLGIGQFKWQLEDLSFRYLNPEAYQKISKALNMRRQDRDAFIKDMIQRLTDLFSSAKFNDISISGRAKHIFSIYRKLERKGVDYSELFDASAFRILLPEVEDCYAALSMVHATWPHIAKEFDDYIAKPKPNGYQSIHTVVIGPDERHIEIQFRTFKMHEEAELGVAAHWKYKEGPQKRAAYEEKIDLLREMVDWQQEISTETSSTKGLYSKIFADRIYVFTPTGDIYDLASGATPLDFAYYIHSEVGHRCRGAKVNGHLVQLTHPLETGDQVEIITSKEGEPSRDWLNPNLGYITTKHARDIVRHWFRKQNFQANLSAGQALWDKHFRRDHITKTKLNALAKHFNFKKGDDLIAALGAGDISAAAIAHQLHLPETTPDSAAETTATIISKTNPPIKKAASSLEIEGVGNLLTQLGRCCKPIPGDAIIGYVTKGHGITIHQESCRNIQTAIAHRPERIMEVHWGAKAPDHYPVDLIIEAADRHGLIRDVSNIIATENITVLGLTTRVNKIENLAHINLTVEIKSLEPLNKIINQLRQIPGVTQVKRR